MSEPSSTKKKGVKQTAAPKERAWTKNHPLEGDGLLVNFYNHMWKKNKDFQSCPGVRCPDTIVYDHNFPRGWYTYDQKNKELKKKQGKELDTSSISNSFCRTPDPNVDIVASYLYSYEQESGETITSVEFFTKDDLADFLNNRKTKKEGILQKFLVPKGLNNSLIQAVWSPRVCIVQRKTNRHAINDKSYSAYERAVTYEGPSHYTEDGICAPKTTAQIKNICSNICQHFQNTEHKNITRMVLYFKVDKNDSVWLLWCGSVRISDRQHQSQMPLNLSPIFTSPDQQTKTNTSEVEESDVLLGVDRHQYALSGDFIFHLTHCSPQSPNKGSPQATSPHSAGEEEVEEDGGSTGSPENPNQPAGVKKSRQEWYMKDEHVHEQYKQIKDEHDFVSQLLDDVFYEAYSHFLKHESGAFYFSLPTQLKQLLGEEQLEKFLAHLGIAPVPPQEVGASGGLDENQLDYWIPNVKSQPFSKLSSECQNYLKGIYDRREQGLRKAAKGGDEAILAYNLSNYDDPSQEKKDEPDSDGEKEDKDKEDAESESDA